MDLTRISRTFAKSLGLTEAELDHAFRPARTEDDLRAVAGLRFPAANADELAEESRYLGWRYLSHPDSPGTLWVFELRGEIIGGVGVERTCLMAAGKPHDTVKLLDVIVREDYRSHGLGAWMNLKLRDAQAITLVFGSNERSQKISDRLLTRMELFTTYKLIFDSADYFSGKLRPAWLSRASIWFFNRLTRLWLRTALFRRGRPGHQTLTRHDDIRPLLQALKHGERPLWIAEDADHLSLARSVEHLRWRFLDHPRYRNASILCQDKAGRLRGYVIYSLRRGDARGSHAVILDWRVSTNCDALAVLTSLFLECVHQCRSESRRLASIRTQTSDPLSERALRRACFLPRGPGDLFYIHQHAPAPIELKDAHWWLTFSDSDVSDLLPKALQQRLQQTGEYQVVDGHNLSTRRRQSGTEQAP